MKTGKFLKEKFDTKKSKRIGEVLKKEEMIKLRGGDDPIPPPPPPPPPKGNG